MQFLRAHHVLDGILREQKKDEKRDPHWRIIRRQFLREHDHCAACAGKTLLQVHHIMPFHERPELELDMGNLVTLCIANLCHLDVGHGGDFKHYNPHVIGHSRWLRRGGRWLDVKKAARAARILNDGPDK